MGTSPSGTVLGRQGRASLELQQGGQHKFRLLSGTAVQVWLFKGSRRCSHGLAVVVGEFGFGKRQGKKTWQPRSPEVRVKGSFLQSTSQHRGGRPSLLFPHGVWMLPFSVEKSRRTQSRNLQSDSSTFSYFELFAYFYYQNVVKNLPRIINLLLLHDRK